MDLSEYKLKSMQEILDLREQDNSRFDKFTTRVYMILEAIKVWEWFDLCQYVEKSARPVFIKIACMAICEGQDLEFSEDFTRIRRTPAVEPMKQPKSKDDEQEERK